MTRHRRAALRKQPVAPSERNRRAEEAAKLTYAEPTPAWRLRRGDQATARATMVPHGFGCTLIWWVNEQLEGAAECGDWSEALAKAREVREGLRLNGFVDADDEG